jgi:hypothetical protein
MLCYIYRNYGSSLYTTIICDGKLYLFTIDTWFGHRSHLTAISIFIIDCYEYAYCFQFLNPSLDGGSAVARPLPTHRTTETQNKRIQTSMPRVGYEPTIPVLEWAKTGPALDRAATVVCAMDMSPTACMFPHFISGGRVHWTEMHRLPHVTVITGNDVLIPQTEAISVSFFCTYFHTVIMEVQILCLLP